MVAEWHRYPSGMLERGELRRNRKCNVTFEIYTPNVISDAQSQVLIVCRNAHTHPLPAPTKTPPIYKSILHKLLLDLKWKLADATPRRALLDTGFMASLRSQLGWPHDRNPVLSDLHPSLANDDHVKRIILDLRDTHFPSGTGFEGKVLNSADIATDTPHPSTKVGVRRLSEQQNSLEEPYVRYAEELTVDGETFRIVVCMTPTMSKYLLRAKRLTMDTSFKRVHSCEEFEIETWQDDLKQCE